MSPGTTAIPFPIVWKAPNPRKLPALRASVRDYFRKPRMQRFLANLVATRSDHVSPYVPGYGGPSAAAIVLALQEAQRLEDARLYFADEDMTVLSVAVGQTAPVERVSADRLPSPNGFMVFATPIASYVPVHNVAFTHPSGEPAAVHVPIVAVSWSIWSPGDMLIAPNPITWATRDPEGKRVTLGAQQRGIWMTFYSSQSMGFEAVPPQTVVGVDKDGLPYTAGEQVTWSQDHAPLTRVDAVFLPFGEQFPSAEPKSTVRWAQVVYTAWQLLQQQGRTGWTETENIRPTAKGPKRKRKLDPVRDTISLIRLRAGHRPSAEAAERDRAEADSTRYTRHTHRWPVPPYRRPNACWNTAIHTDDPATRRCKHAEQIVKGHINGPKGAPLRTDKAPVFLLTPPEPTDAHPPVDQP